LPCARQQKAMSTPMARCLPMMTMATVMLMMDDG